MVWIDFYIPIYFTYYEKRGKKERKGKKEDKIEGTFAIIATLLLLFTAMLNPLVSLGLSIFLLIAFAIYKFVKK